MSTVDKTYAGMCKRLARKAVEELDAIGTDGDPEAIHGKADDIVLRASHPDVKDAYDRLVARTKWWGTA